MVDAGKVNKFDIAQKTMHYLPCGCIYQDTDWMLLRINECKYHHYKRTVKRPYRPKAECVRP